MEKAGEIIKLACQTAFPLRHNGVLVCTYKSDFTYWCNGRLVIEDVKGIKTPVYRLKKKLMLAEGYEITEVK